MALLLLLLFLEENMKFGKGRVEASRVSWRWGTMESHMITIHYTHIGNSQRKNKRYIKEKNECVFIIIDFQSFRNPCNVEILLNSLGFYISIYSLKFPEVSASLQSEPVNLKQALCQPLALLCKARQLQVFKPTNMKEQIIAEGNGKPQARSTVVGNKVVMYEKDPLAILKCSSLRAKCRSAEIAAIETFQH